jgi:hypothetical protein
MDQLQHQSFSVMLLMFAIAGLAPGIGTFAGLLTGITTFQMTIGRAAPFFPRLIVDHLLPVRHLHRMVPYAITALRFIERQIHPRWPGLIRVARLPIGIVVILLSVLLIVLPIPFSNLAPAFCIAMISLAYLEQDGVVLAVSLIVGLTIVWLNSALAWDLIWGAH